jgi:hypothetical protein
MLLPDIPVSEHTDTVVPEDTVILPACACSAFMSAALTATALLAELRLPESLWAGVLKCYGLWLQVCKTPG